MAHCFITRQLPGSALERLATLHDVEIWPQRLPPSPFELTQHTAGADGLLSLLTDTIDAELLAASPRLKAISNYAVGYDNIDLEAATARGIPVGHTPDVLTEATADLTFALLLAAARKLPDAIAAVHAGDWLTWEPAMHLGAEVYGATLGIIGYGRIGQAVARRARGFEMNVIHAGAGDALTQLLTGSDFISIHAPLSPATHHLIDAAALGLMRPSTILINTARGAIIDRDALSDALHNGTIAGAALDVTDPEPLPPDDPLLQTPNLIITPHVGSATRAAREKMAELAVENLIAALDDRPMPFQANVIE